MTDGWRKEVVVVISIASHRSLFSPVRIAGKASNFRQNICCTESEEQKETTTSTSTSYVCIRHRQNILHTFVRISRILTYEGTFSNRHVYIHTPRQGPYNDTRSDSKKKSYMNN